MFNVIYYFLTELIFSKAVFKMHTVCLCFGFEVLGGLCPYHIWMPGMGDVLKKISFLANKLVVIHLEIIVQIGWLTVIIVLTYFIMLIIVALMNKYLSCTGQHTNNLTHDFIQS